MSVDASASNLHTIHIVSLHIMVPSPSVFKIIPTIQQYDWGKIGHNAKVAQFAAASSLPGFSVDESLPYAELWMGTHPKSPSHVRFSGKTLSEHLASNPNLIGKRVIDRFDATDGNLPFLFKVLSIEKALSVQSHPDKKTAEILHAQQPSIYKDPNHKPEMTIALTPFFALCGFRPLPAIVTALNSTPELASLIPRPTLDHFISLASSNEPYENQKAALKGLFSALMTTDEAQYKGQLTEIVGRYRRGQVNDGEEKDVIDLVLRLDGQFPGDIGIWCAFVLNYVRLQPGKAMFLGAGEPHAYIAGECIECMANSDNVIRAGLTPKLRDVPNLVSGLTYSASDASKHSVFPTSFSSSEASVLYDPPVPEFSVVQVKLSYQQTEAHRPVDGPSVAIVTEGSGAVEWDTGERLEVGLGDVYIIGAGTGVEFKSKGTEPFVVYRAFVEVE